MLEAGDLLVIVATPASLPTTIDRTRWPVHVTVAGNFSIGGKAMPSLPAAIRGAADVPAFDVTLGAATRFGPNGDVSVLLAEHPSLHRLHDSLGARLFGVPGFVAQDPDHWGGGYRPHVTVGEAVDAVKGVALRIEFVSLVALRADRGTPIYSTSLR